MINKFKSSSKIKIFILGAVVLGVIIVSFRYLMHASKPDSNSNLEKIGTSIDGSSGKTFGGSGASPDFMQRNTEQNIRDAQEALERNRANLPVITTVTPAPTIVETTPTASPAFVPPAQSVTNPVVSTPAPTPQPQRIDRQQQQTDRARDDRSKAMLEAMKSVRDGMKLSSPKFVVSSLEHEPKKENRDSPNNKDNMESTKGTLNIPPGSKFYVINEYNVNSDSPKDDVIMKVVHPLGYEGSRFFGHFKRYDEMLVVEFDRFLVNGTMHSIKGLAIDPKEADVDVASDVDTHFWTRWLSLAASAMLEGMGEAVRNSGTTTTITSGAVVQTKEETTSRDILIEGAGTVGKKAQGHLAGTFNRPPTVRLYVGAELAVVILESK